MPALWTLAQSAEAPLATAFPRLIVGAIAALVSIVCVLFHYEMMSIASAWLPKARLRRRARIVVLILAALVTHVAEVWIFGLVFWFLSRWPQLGQLSGTFEEGLFDYIYYSVVTYTTLGFGDVIPQGAVRLLTGTEALVGLTLITWSASFAFLEMQRDWSEFRKSAARR